MIGSPDGSGSEQSSVVELVVGSSWTSGPGRGKLMIVEGNIGVGKTTLAKKLAKHLNYKLYLEPAAENPYLGGTLLAFRVTLHIHVHCNWNNLGDLVGALSSPARNALIFLRPSLAESYLNRLLYQIGGGWVK